MELTKEKAIEKINATEGENVIVRTPTEETEFLTNYENTKIEEKIGDRISKAHSQYDDDWFEVTGRRKEGNQKSYHFIKEEGARMEKELKELPTLKQKIVDLEKSGDTASLKIIDGLKKGEQIVDRPPREIT